MGLIFGLLALIPLLSLVPLHWFVVTGSRGGLRKMLIFAGSSCVFWGLLGGYLAALAPAGFWLSLILMLLGMGLSVTCVAITCQKNKDGRRCVLATLVIFPLVYGFIARLVKVSPWVREFDPAKAISAMIKSEGGWQGRLP